MPSDGGADDTGGGPDTCSGGAGASLPDSTLECSSEAEGDGCGGCCCQASIMSALSLGEGGKWLKSGFLLLLPPKAIESLSLFLGFLSFFFSSADAEPLVSRYFWISDDSVWVFLFSLPDEKSPFEPLRSMDASEAALELRGGGLSSEEA